MTEQYYAYSGEEITKELAYTAYQLMDLSMRNVVMKSALMHIADQTIKDHNELDEFTYLYDSIVYDLEENTNEEFDVDIWNTMIKKFTKMNQILGLTEEEIQLKTVEFISDYDDQEAIYKLGLKQLAIIN